MIRVCSGHEKSIGLEVFFKSFIKLDPLCAPSYLLYANLTNIKETLITLNIEYKLISENQIKLEMNTLNFSSLKMNAKLPISTLSLEAALKDMNKNEDILLTLPTSKDQLILNGKNKAGYTEYLREFYKNKNLSMFFSAPNDYLLLITDHIPLNQVSSTIKKDLIIKKISIALDYHQKYFCNFDEVLIAGINPHAGENGILGHEDILINQAISELKTIYSQNFLGPLSGDTLHFYKNSTLKQLKVYMFHDQGLPVFKAGNGVIGLNITLGLPFLRISVDHGTAFNLYGKNISDESGCLYMLEESLKAHNKLHCT